MNSHDSPAACINSDSTVFNTPANQESRQKKVSIRWGHKGLVKQIQLVFETENASNCRFNPKLLETDEYSGNSTKFTPPRLSCVGQYGFESGSMAHLMDSMVPSTVWRTVKICLRSYSNKDPHTDK